MANKVSIKLDDLYKQRRALEKTLEPAMNTLNEIHNKKLLEITEEYNQSMKNFRKENGLEEVTENIRIYSSAVGEFDMVRRDAYVARSAEPGNVYSPETLSAMAEKTATDYVEKKYNITL